MFGPIRGPWQDESWTGWWGENPPFHNDVFVLTHHRRESLAMEGGTTFHFINDTPDAVLTMAFNAAKARTSCWAAALRRFSSSCAPA
jgi:dihydrofolate reductase